MKQRDARQIPAAIQWHDGLLLEPQHFQEATRRQERLLDYHLARLAPHHYGVVRCEIDQKVLPDGLLRVNALEAVLPDGLVVLFSADDGLKREAPPKLELDLTAPAIKALLAGSDPVEVHVAVASEEQRGGESSRYDVDATADAANDLDGPNLDVPRLVPHITLVVPKASAVPASSRVSMPIARIKRDSKGYEQVAYEPPCLAVGGGSPLNRLCANQIVLPLREKAGRLASAALALSDSTPVAFQRKVGLERQVASLVSGLPPLEALLDSGRAHPYALYLALAGVVGQAAGASAALLPPKLADYPYDHEDLIKTFLAVRKILTGICDGILESFQPYTLRYDRELKLYQVDPPPGWRTRWLAIGVRPFEARAQLELTNWMREARIGVQSQLAAMPMGRAFGAPRAPRAGCDDAVKDALREIVPPEGGDVYWLDRTAGTLDGQGPLIVQNVGDAQATSDRFQLVLYISNEPAAAGGNTRR